MQSVCVLQQKQLAGRTSQQDRMHMHATMQLGSTALRGGQPQVAGPSEYLPHLPIMFQYVMAVGRKAMHMYI
jgi:hypothetical protein